MITTSAEASAAFQTPAFPRQAAIPEFASSQDDEEDYQSEGEAVIEDSDAEDSQSVGGVMQH
jgi:hypothetical protein